MAIIPQSSVAGHGIRTVTPLTLTSSDTFSYVTGIGQKLMLHNPTAGSITATVTGSGATSLPAPQGGLVNYATGLAIAVPAGQTRVVVTDNNAGYLVGNITVTGGTGLLAWLIGDA